MNSPSEFPPKGHHIEHTDSPYGPMDIIAPNEGRKLHIDLFADTPRVGADSERSAHETPLELPILTDDAVSRDLFTARGDRNLIRKILATSEADSSTAKKIDEA